MVERASRPRRQSSQKRRDCFDPSAILDDFSQRRVRFSHKIAIVQTIFLALNEFLLSQAERTAWSTLALLREMKMIGIYATRYSSLSIKNLRNNCDRSDPLRNFVHHHLRRNVYLVSRPIRSGKRVDPSDKRDFYDRDQ